MKNNEFSASSDQPSQAMIDEINEAMQPVADEHATAMGEMDSIETNAQDEKLQLHAASAEAIKPVEGDLQDVDAVLHEVVASHSRNNEEGALLSSAGEALQPVEAELHKEDNERLASNEQAFDAMAEPLRNELSDQNIDILIARWQAHEAQNDQTENNLAVAAARATYLANQDVTKAVRSQLPEEVSAKLSEIDAKADHLNASYNEHTAKTDEANILAYNKLKKQNTVRNILTLGIGSKKRAKKLSSLVAEQQTTQQNTYNQLQNYGAGITSERDSVVEAVKADKVNRVDELAGEATQAEHADSTFEATVKDLYTQLDARKQELYANYDAVVKEALENTQNDPNFTTMTPEMQKTYLSNVEHEIKMTYQSRGEIINLESRTALNRALVARLNEEAGTNSRLDMEAEVRSIRGRTGGVLDDNVLDNLRIRATHENTVTKAPEIDTTSNVHPIPQLPRA